MIRVHIEYIKTGNNRVRVYAGTFKVLTSLMCDLFSHSVEPDV